MLKKWFSRDLQSVLTEKKAIKIKGISFVIKKIDALAFFDGSRIMIQVYDTYKSSRSPEAAAVSEKKIREHFGEVIVAGCVNPKFSHKENDEGCIWVNEIFKDMEIANALYESILGHTYGKKKLNFYHGRS